MSPTTSPTVYDVAVVGAGPSGLALARLLSMRGRRVALVDPNRIVCQHPRATHLDDETMRTLQTLGAADLERNFLRQEAWRLTAPGGAVFLELVIPEGETDQGWQSDYQFHQPDFESRLRGLLAGDPNIDLCLGVEATALSSGAEDVEIATRDLVTGKTGSVRAAYVVGADGANSFVRRSMVGDIEDLHGTQRSLIVDIHPFEHPESLPTKAGFVLCDGERPVTYVPIFPPKLRFEFMLAPGDDAIEFSRPGRVYELLAPWLAAGSYRIMRTDVYEWHAHLIRGWRDGRLLLAGDAAHEMPPMLGQGMCSGLRDAANLAWKLDTVLAGASEGLLDTYESERAPHVRPYIAESARQSNMIEAFGNPATRPEPGPPQVIERYRPLLGPGVATEPGGSVGQLAPQPLTAGGIRLDDLVGYQFLVVGTETVLEAVTEGTRETWGQLGAVVLDAVAAGLGEWLTANDSEAAIIRPDRYVHAVVRGAGELDAATSLLAVQALPMRTPA